MAKTRLTINMLKKLTDTEIIRIVLHDRREELKEYSPARDRLNAIINNFTS